MSPDNKGKANRYVCYWHRFPSQLIPQVMQFPKALMDNVWLAPLPKSWPERACHSFFQHSLPTKKSHDSTGPEWIVSMLLQHFAASQYTSYNFYLDCDKPGVCNFGTRLDSSMGVTKILTPHLKNFQCFPVSCRLQNSQIWVNNSFCLKQKTEYGLHLFCTGISKCD